jgi:hypothetical protein
MVVRRAPLRILETVTTETPKSLAMLHCGRRGMIFASSRSGCPTLQCLRPLLDPSHSFAGSDSLLYLIEYTGMRRKIHGKPGRHSEVFPLP